MLKHADAKTETSSVERVPRSLRVGKSRTHIGTLLSAALVDDVKDIWFCKPSTGSALVLPAVAAESAVYETMTTAFRTSGLRYGTRASIELRDTTGAGDPGLMLPIVALQAIHLGVC